MTVDFYYNEGPRGVLGLGRLNLGDLLCSPSSYFKLESDTRTVIIGGGIQSNYITGEERPPDGYDKVVVWGGGLSSHPQKALQSGIDGLDVWTIRDREIVPSVQHWLPCVSCMHPMLDHPAVESVPGRSLLYVNADPVIYSPSALMKSRKIATEHGLDFCTNRADERDFFDMWHKCERVVTNSYHGIYWSLLAGKEVVVFGYNFKFTSVLSMFGLGNKIITFEKRDRAKLEAATREAVAGQNTVCLPDAAKVLGEYREMQRRFAQRLVEQHIILSFSQTTYVKNFIRPKSNSREIKRILAEYIGATDRRLSGIAQRIKPRRG